MEQKTRRDEGASSSRARVSVRKRRHTSAQINAEAQNEIDEALASQKTPRKKVTSVKRSAAAQQPVKKGMKGTQSSTAQAVRKNANAKLKVIPLGGLDVIGRNMTVFECGQDMIIDDAGLMFPDDDHPGIDLILPDYTYVLQNAHKLRGIFITHGHEDHTGCLPYLLKDLDCQVPIYATKMTLGLIKLKLEEHRIKNAKLVEIKAGQQIKMGCFTVEFFSVNHSIPGAVGAFVQTPAGNVLHTGDFKLDQSPVDGVRTDFAAMARFSQMGVDLLMSDSTNADTQSFTRSESEVGKTLEDLIRHAEGRVIVAAFASHIHRIQQVCDAAVKNGRKVVVTGRSMVQNTDIARRLGYLQISEDNLIDAFDLKSIPSEKVVILCTGSQGEPLSALARISNSEHRTISIEPGDTVIISATPVPGNEKAVTRIINNLSRAGVDVYDKSKALVHVSGHAGPEELKIVLSIVAPKYFMPVHGEATHLRAHSKLAKMVGIPEDYIFILDNCETLELTTKGVKRGASVTSGIVYVDGLTVGDTSDAVLEERVQLQTKGFACVAAAVSFRKATLVSDVQITMRGMTGGDDVYLQDEAQKVVTNAIRNALSKGVAKKDLTKICKDSLLSILWERAKQRPMVVINILDV